MARAFAVAGGVRTGDPERMDPASAPVLRGFGGVAAVGPGGAVELGGAKQRAVLALLLVEPGTVVPLDQIVDRIWAESPPARAEVSVRGYVSNLRKALATVGFDAASVIEFRDRGYVLQVPRGSVDLHQFDALVDEAGRLAGVGDTAGARRLLTRALDLYGGPPLGATAEELALGEVVAHYEERRGEAVEALADLRLALGEHAQLPAALASEIARQPYRERLRAQLALALYRSGRSVEALRSLHEARRLLNEDVGVEPGPELRDLEAAILAHDAAALAWVQPAPPDPAPAAAGGPAPVLDDEPRFGRGAEEAQYRALLDRLAVRGGVLVVSGEAGIGKSSLLRGLRAEARRRGLVVGWDRCPESAAGAPYRSWRWAVEALLPGGELLLDARGDEQEAAGALLATHLRELDRLSTRTEPAVVVIDDLQWADDATLSLLQFLGPELERLRVLLAVGIRRTGTELAPAVRDCVAELARTTDPAHVTLAGLGPAAIAEWLTERTGHTPAPGLIGYLADTTGGNPFYVRELLAMLDADGRLAGDVDPAAAPGRDTVPHAVQDVVRRRTSRLPPDTQAVIMAAAVIGRRFDLDVLAGVLDIGVAEALGRLEPALDDGLVEPDDIPGRFAFSHALVSNTLAAELNAARLAQSHARITDVLEALRADDLDPWVEDLAHHAAAGLVAGTAAKALTYARRAADAAASAQSSADVAVQLRRALAASALIPGFPGEERRELVLRLGTALRDTGDVEGRTMLVEAARLAEAQGDAHALAAILASLDTESLWAGYDWNLHDPRVVAAVERALGQPGLSERDRTLLTMALAAELTYLDNARSNRLFAEAEAMAAPLQDAVLSARVLLRWFASVSGPSGRAARASIGDRLIALDGEGALPARLRPLAHLARVSAALEEGDIEQARRCVGTARMLAHPVRTPTGWAHLQWAEAGLALLDGELERARAHAAALRPALARVRRYTAESSPASVLAVVESEAGDTDAALEWLSVLLRSPYAEPIHWLRAWILAAGGRSDEARAALAGFDGPLPDDWLYAPLTTAAVHAAATVGDLGFLRRHLPALAPVADRFVFVGEGGFCLGPVGLAAAAAHAALGHPAAAREHAEQALALSERMGAVLWLPRVRRLLDGLPAS
jgi:DNA-binding SARP family transcriptional activator